MRAEALYKAGDNPAREAFFDAERIQREVEVARFRSLMSADKNRSIVPALIQVAGKQGWRIQKAKTETVVGLSEGQRLMVSQPVLDAVDINHGGADDYTVQGLPIVEKWNAFRASAIRTHESDSIVKTFESNKEMVAAISEYQQQLEYDALSFRTKEILKREGLSDYSRERLEPNEVYATNLPKDFDFVTFKKLVKSLSSETESFLIERDYLDVPGKIRIAFATVDGAVKFIKEVAKSTQSQFARIKYMQDSDLESETFANRTIVIQGLKASETATEFLTNCACWGAVDSFSFPVSIRQESTPSTAEVSEYVKRNPQEFENCAKVTALEQHVKGVSEIEIFNAVTANQSTILDFEDMIRENGDGFNVLSKDRKKLRQTVNKYLEKGFVEMINTVPIESRFKAKNVKKSTSTATDTTEIINDTNITKYLTFGKNQRNESVRSRKTSKMSPTAIDIQGDSVGSCYVTMASVWEAKKAIYALKYASYFSNPDVSILGQTELADHMDFVAQRVYLDIHQNRIKRKEIEKEIAEMASGPDPMNPQLTMESIHTQRMAEERQVSQYDYDAKRVQEEAFKEKIRRKKELTTTMKDYMNTFVSESEFSEKPYLESNLVDLGEVESIRAKRGRSFEQTRIDERIQTLQRQLEKSKLHNAQKDAQKGRLLTQGLNKLVKGHQSKDVQESLVNIATEYGLKNTELDNLKHLLRQKLVERYEKRQEVFDENKSSVLPMRPPESKKINRLDFFNSIGKKSMSFRQFSTVDKQVGSDVDSETTVRHADAYARLFTRLEAKYLGTHFQSDFFSNYAIKSFIKKREK